MKKIFTLFASMVLAIAANAQVVAFEPGDQDGGTAGNVSYSFAADTYTYKADGKESFSGYLSGKANPKLENNRDYSPGGTTAPSSGSVLNLTPSKSGVLSVYVVCNSGKSTFVLKNGKAIEFTTDDGEKLPPASMFESKYYGYLTIEVAAGNTYSFFCNGSKMGFYGYELNTGSADLTALSQKIAEANAIENPSEDLQKAIAAAGDVLDKEGVTQAEVDAAVKNLDDAIGVFNSINTVSVSAAKVAKAMVNGKVVIVKGAKQYNVAGQEL